MNFHIGGMNHTPSAYKRPGPNAADLAKMYIKEWDNLLLKMKQGYPPKEILPTIYFSRKIGTGALMIADLLGEKIGYRVVDREILDLIARSADHKKETVSATDECNPKKSRGNGDGFHGEDSFIESDYIKHLFSGVLALASLGPTIFVGRGVHFILPRDRVLSVRFLSSKNHRVRNIAGALNVHEEDAEGALDQIDREQKRFFNKVYGKISAPPEEFDLVINCDQIPDPGNCAELVAQAFRFKFGDEAATRFADKKHKKT
ncbi:MAG: cytidylate kinase-like family protein [Deltaproteobacteria bacterium]|nr:cytidylate kinase-like family protein [Deltaproteobacteria bacterium]